MAVFDSPPLSKEAQGLSQRTGIRPTYRRNLLRVTTRSPSEGLVASDRGVQAAVSPAKPTRFAKGEGCTAYDEVQAGEVLRCRHPGDLPEKEIAGAWHFRWCSSLWTAMKEYGHGRAR